MADNWQNKLKISFESYTESAPEGLWEAVSAGVASARATRVRRRRMRAFSYSAAAFAALAALAFILFSPSGEKAGEPASAPVELLAQSDPGEPQLIAAVLPAPKALRAERPTEISAAEEALPAPVPAEPAPAPADPTPAPAQMVQDEQEPILPEWPEEEQWPEELQSRRRLSLNFQLSNALVRSTAASSAEVLDIMLSSGNYVLLSSRASYNDISDNLRHHQPVSLGFSLGLELSKRLSLESGINYTLLYSDYLPEAQNTALELKQSIHYLGVPLNLRFDFLRSEAFGLYLSGGAMAQKAIYGCTDLIHYTRQGERKENRIELKEDQFQFSLNASLGAYYSISPGLSLYLQPGISYHLDNGSDIANIYKKRPLNFSLSLGLRLDIAP